MGSAVHHCFDDGAGIQSDNYEKKKKFLIFISISRNKTTAVIWHSDTKWVGL